MYLNQRQYKICENDLITIHHHVPLDIGDKIKLEKVFIVFLYNPFFLLASHETSKFFQILNHFPNFFIWRSFFHILIINIYY